MPSSGRDARAPWLASAQRHDTARARPRREMPAKLTLMLRGCGRRQQIACDAQMNASKFRCAGFPWPTSSRPLPELDGSAALSRVAARSARSRAATSSCFQKGRVVRQAERRHADPSHSRFCRRRNQGPDDRYDRAGPWREQPGMSGRAVRSVSRGLLSAGMTSVLPRPCVFEVRLGGRIFGASPRVGESSQSSTFSRSAAPSTSI